MVRAPCPAPHPPLISTPRVSIVCKQVLQLLGREGGLLALLGLDVGNGIDIGF